MLLSSFLVSVALSARPPVSVFRSFPSPKQQKQHREPSLRHREERGFHSPFSSASHFRADS